MKNQINSGDQNTLQTGQGPVSQSVQYSEKQKINYWMISTIILVVLLLGAVVRGLFLAKNKSFRPSSKISISSPVITTAMPPVLQTYINIKYNYELKLPSDWTESEVDSGEETRFFKANNTQNLNASETYISISVKDNPLRKPLRDWLIGENILPAQNDISNHIQESVIQVGGTTVIQISTPVNGGQDTVYIPLDYNKEILQFTYIFKDQDSKEYENLTQTFRSILSTFRFTNGFSLTGNKNSNVSGWAKYSGDKFSFLYPESWVVGVKEIDGTSTIDLTKMGGELMTLGYKIPEVFIGSPEIFSTSGALCGNATFGECTEAGSANASVNSKEYSGQIIKKALFNNNGTIDSYYYVFTLELVPYSGNSVVTAIFKDQAQGQEILDIISTISF